MKTIFEHIEYAKSKPHHIRKQIVFTSAAGISILIALVWLIASFSTNSFAIKGSTFADSTGQSTVETVSDSENEMQNIAGAAAALPDKNAPAHIEIIDTTTSVPEKNKAEQTTIPF